MKPPVPLQFLVGLTRLIAVYFAMRSLDHVGGVMGAYAIQASYMQNLDMGTKLPSVWIVLIPTLMFYLALTAGVWFAAPFIGKLAFGSPSENAEAAGPEVCWNHVMIFLVGVLLVGWGLARGADSAVPIIQATVFQKTHELTSADAIVLFTTVGFIGFGVILMARFAGIYRWMQRRIAT